MHVQPCVVWTNGHYSTLQALMEEGNTVHLVNHHSLVQPRCCSYLMQDDSVTGESFPSMVRAGHKAKQEKRLGYIAVSKPINF